MEQQLARDVVLLGDLRGTLHDVLTWDHTHGVTEVGGGGGGNQNEVKTGATVTVAVPKVSSTVNISVGFSSAGWSTAASTPRACRGDSDKQVTHVLPSTRQSVSTWCTFAQVSMYATEQFLRCSSNRLWRIRGSSKIDCFCQ